MIYLDNSATTPLAPEAADAMTDFMRECYGNPSSLHAKGRQALHALTAARKTIADYMGVLPSEVYFTSGGTEADNIAILGSANLKKGSRIVTDEVEHPAVLNTMKHLEDMGFEIVRIKPRSNGIVDAQDVIDAVNEKTRLVSIMHVNNETGSVMDIAAISKGAKKKSPRVLIHTDAVQSFGHIKTRPYELGVDLMSVSSHKIHGPKGIGFLFVKKGINDLQSPIYGGGHENALRSGTENTYAIVGFAKAVELIDLNDSQRVGNLRQSLKEKLEALDNVYYNGGENASPYILNMSFPGVRSEVMLNALDSSGICVSSASACARGKAKSYVLEAMGAKYVDNAIRFSFSRYNTEEDVLLTVKAVREILEAFRR